MSLFIDVNIRFSTLKVLITKDALAFANNIKQLLLHAIRSISPRRSDMLLMQYTVPRFLQIASQNQWSKND